MTLSASITAQVAGTLTLSRRELPARALAEIRSRLTVDNPAYIQSLRRVGRAWGIDPTLCAVAVEGDRVTVPRGAWSIVRTALAADGMRLVWDARGITEGQPLGATLGEGVTLRDYQREAVDAMARASGLVIAPCGAGKTVLGVAAIAAAARAALILVHTADLAAQWVATARTMLGVTATRIGAGGASELAIGPVVVATVQTLSKHRPEAIAAWGAHFGVVLLDEAHHAPARTFADVLGVLPARLRWGLTATPDRADGLGPYLGWTFGPVLARIDAAELFAAGTLMRPRWVPVWTDHECRCDPSDWAAVVEGLVTDDDRNRLIVETTAGKVRAGGAVLVITGRVEHAERLAVLMRERGLRAAAASGQSASKARARVMDDMRSGALDVLVATTIADEGLDVPRLSAVVLATPSRHAGRTVQRAGRTSRVHEGKSPPEVLDLIDGKVGPLIGQAYARRRALAEAGYDVPPLRPSGAEREGGAAGGRAMVARSPGAPMSRRRAV